MDALDRSLDGNVLTLTLDRPEALNAFDMTLRAELHEALEDAATDDDVRCVVVTGAGGAFSAGGDVTRMRERLAGGLTAATFESELDGTANELMRTLYRLPVPTLTKVDGVAVGMGLSVALACDVVVASEDATFGAAFRNVGLGPDTGLSYLLPRRVGTGTALELLYTGERIGAAEADEYGLVDRVVPPEELDPVVEELAVSIASGPTMALAAAKELILDGLDRDFEEALDAEAAKQALLYTTDDHREGVRAFEEKRRPEFEGR
jgi:enoyl-CoA hydratase/carnithine racemase